MKNFITLSLLAMATLATASLSLAEDVELYISDVVKEAGLKPKVLLILDNSNSMNKLQENAAGFDSLKEYPPEDAANAYNDAAIYFNIGGADNVSTIPDSPSDARRFNALINGCHSSIAALEKFGYYTGHIREYRTAGNSGSWEELPNNNGLNIEVLDCEEDVPDPSIAHLGSKKNGQNRDGVALPDGYPANYLSTKEELIYHTDTLTDANKVTWSGKYVTLYTAKYLRWYHSAVKEQVLESRLEDAMGAITELINTTSGIEFGLATFNFNNGDLATTRNGGRVVYGINAMNTTNKATLSDIVNNQFEAHGETPLCESMYEASQYFAGKAVDFGDDDSDYKAADPDYKGNQPLADKTVINADNNYITPFENCSDVAYVILITDGEPTNDAFADSKITALQSIGVKLNEDDQAVLDADGNPILEDKFFKTENGAYLGKDDDDARVEFNNTIYSYTNSLGKVVNSYLPALAGWMYGYDANTNLDGKQTVKTFTVGFSDEALEAAPVLEETAKRGGGDYFHANDSAALIKGIQALLRELTPSNNTLTSASVAANNFDRTETLNSVYYAMFDPRNGPRWRGNLKKYKVVNGVQQGSQGKPALDNKTGHFSAKVLSYWSSVDEFGNPDGASVSKGGVAEWFSKQAGDSRTVYMDGSDNSQLIAFNRANLQEAFTDQTGLATELGVAGAVDGDGNNIESAAIDEMINWAVGMDVDNDDGDENGDRTDMRADVFGDPLHSKPLVINYGDSIRIVIGTNAGALHMFEDKDTEVVENWAFMPKKLTKNIKKLRDNYAYADKVYGIDGQITSHINDKDGDGIINGDDTVWIFFGLRRGGSSYYAMDITNPTSPKLMWHKDGDSLGFDELGQSWSQPKIGYSQLNISGTIAKPVLFIGGGYDINKDKVGPGTDDSDTGVGGRAVYMLDAETGSLLWSMAPKGGDTTFNGTDSIPSSIGLLDSDGDGLVDRLYTGDTGGNLWRVDMPGKEKTDFSVFKLASLGGDTNATDRRFFYEPSIVRTFIAETIQTEITDKDGITRKVIVHQEKPYEAILISSGDRSNPLGTDTVDKLFMIKDEHIKTQTFSADTKPPIPTVITSSDTDLYNFTEDKFAKDLTDDEREALELAVSAKSGWYINLEQPGEKGTSAAIAINGVAYFTTFTPPAFGAPLIDCKPPLGKGWLYAVDLAQGTKVYNWQAEDSDNREDRIALISEQFLGSPTLIVLPENPDDDKSDAVGNLIVGRKMINVNFRLKTMRTYLYITEEQ